MQTVDIAILGGGLVGLTLANLLAESTNYNIAIIDQNLPIITWDADTYDIRVSAISRASQNILQQIGVWDNIANHRVGVYRQMLVWDAITAAKIEFDAAEFGESDLGHIVENRVMHAALWYKLQSRVQTNNVAIIYGKAHKMCANDQGQQLTLITAQNGEDTNYHQLQAKLIVGADGANSWLRQYQRIGIKTWELDQHAIVANVHTSQQHQDIARQVFTTDGPLAFLPLDQNSVCSIVWSGSAEHTARRMQLSAEDFCRELDQTFAYTLGNSKLLGERANFPIKPLHADTYIGHRTVLVGDSAHVVHPLAGQGLNLGLKDVVMLADLLQKYGLSKTTLGLRKTLRKYERSRRGDNLLMLQTCIGFKHLFSTDNSFMMAIRSKGLDIFNNLGWVKYKLALHAMGVA